MLGLSRRMFGLRLYTMTLIVCTALGACSPREADVSHAADNQGSSGAAVAYRGDTGSLLDRSVRELPLYFRPRSGERDSLNTVLRVLAADPSTPMLLGGGVHRFALGSSTGRYLAALWSEAGADSGGHFYMYELRTGARFAVSRAYRVRSTDPGLVAIHDIADFDGDGLADVALCQYEVPSNATEDEAASPPGGAILLGYKDAKWYLIEHPARRVPTCSA